MENLLNIKEKSDVLCNLLSNRESLKCLESKVVVFRSSVSRLPTKIRREIEEEKMR